MELLKTETSYYYKLNQTEMLTLAGILSILDKDGEIKLDDKESKEMVKNLLAGLVK